MRALSYAVASILALGSQAMFCQEPGDCQDIINDAFSTYAGGYSYEFLNTDTMDEYRLGMIRFTGDENGDPIADQGSKGPLLLMHSATQDCLTWLTATADEDTDSIPLSLFKDGYDVFLGCRRGTYYSRRIATPEDLEISGADEEKAFFDYDIQTVGENDVPAFITKILFTNKSEQGTTCQKVQILTFGLGISEAIAGMAKYPNDSDKRISNVVALSPCAVATYLVDDPIQPAAFDSARRLLSAPEIPRELAEITEADASAPKGRQLWHGPSNYYWNVTLKNYCDHNPAVCEKYCEFYPDYCDDFCSREQFAQFCTEPVARGRCALNEALARNDVYSWFGPNWEAQVAALCADVGEWTTTCAELQDTLDSGFKEMSARQIDHMFQHSYRRAYNQYQSDFCEADGELAAGVPIAGVDGINVPLKTFYKKGDDFCDTAVNQAVLNTVPGQDYYSTLYDSSIERIFLGQNNNTIVTGVIGASLDDTPTDLDSCNFLFDWTD